MHSAVMEMSGSVNILMGGNGINHSEEHSELSVTDSFKLELMNCMSRERSSGCPFKPGQFVPDQQKIKGSFRTQELLGGSTIHLQTCPTLAA